MFAFALKNLEKTKLSKEWCKQIFRGVSEYIDVFFELKIVQKNGFQKN